MTDQSTASYPHDLRIGLSILEFHVAFGCNLTCESCAHYSNHAHAGNIAPSELERQIALWNRKIVPRNFRLLGGEPTLNKDLLDLISIARQGWPVPGHDGAGPEGSNLELITNGLRLDRFPGLPALLEQTRCHLVISIHHDSPDYARALEPIVKLVRGWRAAHDIRVSWRRSYEKWSRRYHGYGSAIKPFTDGDQRRSWTNCPAKRCVQLLDGKLWKCPAVAYLPMQHAKYQLGEDWQPYLRYQALGPDATQPEIAAFLTREDEPVCLMCPAQPPRFEKPNPLTKARAQ
jgi:radical SAM family protein/4Fe-4S single cluster protein